jgi:hypothetical protein
MVGMNSFEAVSGFGVGVEIESHPQDADHQRLRNHLRAATFAQISRNRTVIPGVGREFSPITHTVTLGVTARRGKASRGANWSGGWSGWSRRRVRKL